MQGEWLSPPICVRRIPPHGCDSNDTGGVLWNCGAWHRLHRTRHGSNKFVRPRLISNTSYDPHSSKASLRASKSSSRRKSKVNLDLADPVRRISCNICQRSTTQETLSRDLVPRVWRTSNGSSTPHFHNPLTCCHFTDALQYCGTRMLIIREGGCHLGSWVEICRMVGGSATPTA